jgi:hypothetical protein
VKGDESSSTQIPDRDSDHREMDTPRSRWDAFVWPRWLPSRARLPLIAQIAGAFALMAAVTMPKWTVDSATPSAASPPTVEAPAASPAPVATVTPNVAPGPRPAHLNLDLRHNFRSVDLTVTVDGKRALETKLEGSGRKFGVFGRREARAFTRTLDLEPGARVVRLRLRSADEKFDHARVERFDLGPASVATMRVDIEKAGLSVIADRPAPPPSAALPVPVSAQVLPAAHASEAAQAAAQAAQEAHEASALAALYQSLRSVLITLAGLIGSTATAYVVQEFLKQRRVVDFKGGPPTQAARILRRRRERRSVHESDIRIDAGLS